MRALKPDAGAAPESLPAGLVLLLAAIAGFGVASIYFPQPMLEVMRIDLRASGATIGLVPTLMQAGYSLGICFVAPLGDRFDRRKIILTKAAIVVMALAGCAALPRLDVLLSGCVVIGLAATLAQDAVSSSATLAPGKSRGRIVGSVMTGLLLGILLCRVLSGLVAARFGWRAMFAVEAASVAVIGLLAWRRLPSIPTSTALRYPELIASLGTLWRKHPALRRAASAQALLAFGFGGFWATLALMLSGAPFYLGSAAAGSFGFAGAVGALAAPLAGRLADRRGPELVTRLGASLTALSFAGMLLATFLPPSGQLVVLVIAVIGFDLGVQGTLIAHQTIVYGIDPAARSRLNAVLFTLMFAGMSAGAGLLSLAFSAWGWRGVTALAATAATGALALRWTARTASRGV